MTAFDNWLANQNDDPVHFQFDPHGLNWEWEIGHTEIDGTCSNCAKTIGIDSDNGSATPYWQIDIDAEHLLCDECYSEATAEV